LIDLTVIALTYEIEKQEVGTEHLKTEPQISKTIVAKSKQPKTGDFESKSQLPGFYMSKDTDTNVIGKNETLLDPVIDDEESMNDDELAEQIAQLTCNPDPNEQEVLVKVDNNTEDDLDDHIEVEDELEVDQVTDDDEDDDDDVDSGWITPSNIKTLKMGLDPQSYSNTVPVVACMTADFAMQNVLKQLGLQVSALDGRVIKYTRTFILRCYSCFKTTTDVTKIFCRWCGNKTLKRVSVSVDKNGKQMIHINGRKPLSTKFKNQSLPAPKGGKHACNPILFEDQPIPQQRLAKKAMIKTNALDDDYIAGYSPFVLRDVDSRSAMLRNTNNIKQWMKNYEYDNHRRGYNKNK